MASNVCQSVSHSIGELCVGGDWACAHGDVGTLENIARLLADRLSQPISDELGAVAELCRTAPERAFEAWTLVKEHVWRCQP